MIKIENVSTVGWEAAIRGARNPMNSWEKSDSLFYNLESEFIQNLVGDRLFVDPGDCQPWTYSGPTEKRELYSWAIDDSDDMDELSEDADFYLFDRTGVPAIGPNDLKLLTNLAKAGSDEAKFRRMIVVYVDITAPMYWWKECDTYKVGTVRNSCSTMHKIHAKEFTLEDFSTEHLYSDELETLEELIQVLNGARELYLDGKRKEDWWQMIQLLPSSYNQRATLMLNYEVLANMYHARKFHKLDCWREFCAWIETLPYAKELIIGFQMRTDIYKPEVLSKDRIKVNVCAEKDGVIELRRGVPDLYLGDGVGRAQVRIQVDQDHYVKGMAVYADDMPEDFDVVVNVRDKSEAFRDLDYKCAFSRYSYQKLKQVFYKDPSTGDFKLSPINIISDSFDWAEWSRSLPTTFLSKEKEQELIKKADEHLRKGGVDIPEEEENNS